MRKIQSGNLYEEIVTHLNTSLPDEAVSVSRTNSKHGRVEQKGISIIPALTLPGWLLTF